MANRRQFLKWSGALPWLAPVSVSTVATACASSTVLQSKPYSIDTSIHSDNQDSRVRHLVLHYTAEDEQTSLSKLTQPKFKVSAHYLVPRLAHLTAPKVYQLVEEGRRAWHAGVSYWQGNRLLNSSSIGIEIVNLGYPSPEQDQWPWMQRHWIDFDPAQITVVGQLAADITVRHGIQPEKVVGHSDVAPGRKEDPGPKFPWERLYREFNVGAWPEEEAIQYYRTQHPYQGDVAYLQRRLLAYGYDTPQTGVLDQATKDVIAAFQMHFRAAKYDGEPDVETSAILDALLEKYLHWPRS